MPQLRTGTPTAFFLAVSNPLDFDVDQVNIKVAFLNGKLEETMYLDTPEGFEIGEGKVLLLCKSLYGLKQSPGCFNTKFDARLKTQQLTPLAANPCVYIQCTGNNILMLSVHVEDQLPPTNKQSWTTSRNHSMRNSSAPTLAL